MNKYLVRSSIFIFLFFCNQTAPAAAPVDLLLSDNKIIVAEKKSSRLSIYKVDSNNLIQTINLDFQPSALAMHPSGDLIVCGGGAQGQLVRMDVQTGKMKYIVNVAHTPAALVIDEKQNKVYVANRFSNTISVIRADNGKIDAEFTCVREPITLTLAGEQNQYLLVGNHLPLARGLEKHIASEICVFSTVTGERIRNIKLPNGAMAIKYCALSTDRRYAFFTHTLGRYTLPTTQLERGWMNTAALSVIDCQTQSLYATLLLDDVQNGFANPFEIVVHPKTGMMAISSFGTDEVMIMLESDLLIAIQQYIDHPRDIKDAYAYWPKIKDRLGFCADFRFRIACPGRGARALAISANNLFVGMYFSDEIATVDLHTRQTSSFPLSERLDHPIRRGEALFHDASICFQQWQSCATCHPDARMDALNWDLLNDGLGNPKNTHSLLLSHKTPPVMSTGVRDRAETAVRAGMHHIQFIEYSPAEATLIDEFLKNMQPVTSPFRNRDGSLTQSAVRGETLFKKAGCIGCHPPPLYTDGQIRNVGTGVSHEKHQTFDTPSLVELWRTAPYLHDGRALTVREAITEFNHGHLRGNTALLSESELDELVEFLLSL